MVLAFEFYRCGKFEEKLSKYESDKNCQLVIYRKSVEIYCHLVIKIGKF